MRDHIFISYSHKDQKWLDELRNMLKPLVRDKKLSVWDDTMITPGALWREEIKKALVSATVAVLLVSKDFLASDFIVKHELPPLLEAAEAEGVTILWIAVTASLYQETEIERYQAVNNPSRPLNSLRAADRDRELVKICTQIKNLANKKFDKQSNSHSSTTSTLDINRTIERQRKLEAAMPKTSFVGRKTEIQIMISLPNSRGLRGFLPIETEAGDRINRDDVRQSKVPIQFPVNPYTGEPRSILLLVQVSADDFTVEQSSRIIEVSAKYDHGPLSFQVTPRQVAQESLVLVELFKDEQAKILLGSLTLRTTIEGHRLRIGNESWLLVTAPLLVAAMGTLDLSSDVVDYSSVSTSSTSEPFLKSTIAKEEQGTLFTILTRISPLLLVLAFLGLLGGMFRGVLPAIGHIPNQTITPIIRPSTSVPQPSVPDQHLALLDEARQWQQKFKYTFDNGDAYGWDVDGHEDEYGVGQTSITPEGKYRWDVVNKQVTTWWVPPPVPVSDPIGDFYAAVEVRKLPGSSEQIVPALVFRSPDDNNSYSFRVRSNGQLYSAFEYSPNQSEIGYMQNMGPTQSNTIREDEANKLTVIARGPAFYFYVNDEFVGQTVDSRLDKGRVLIGVVMPQQGGGEHAVVEWDNFELRVPRQQ